MEIFSNEKKGKKKQFISVIWGYSWYMQRLTKEAHALLTKNSYHKTTINGKRVYRHKDNKKHTVYQA